MQTMRVCTFEKQDDVDEMEELLAPPQKRTRHQKDVRPLQVLSGIVFTRYRRSLTWKYHRMKSELLEKKAPVMSKEDWLKEEGSREVHNFAELDQTVRGQTALTYSHQRLRVLQDRKVKNNGLLEDLRKCIYTGKSYTKIRETAIEEDKDIIDLTEDSPKFTLESTTKVQLNRVTVQCITVLGMLQQIDFKNDKETSILKDFMFDHGLPTQGSAAREEKLKEHEELKRKFRVDHTMIILSEKVRTLTGAVISAKKIREWYHNYLENQSFEEDSRGTWKREMFLEGYGYSLRFQIYLKNEKRLTVDAAAKELDIMIQKDPPKTEEGRKAFDSLRPFSKRTVHRL